MVYELGQGKAYVKGYEIEKLSTSNIDVNKPRDTSTVEIEQVTIDVGPVLKVHNVYGAPVVGFGTTITLQFRDDLVGSVSTTASGNIIGELVYMTITSLMEFMRTRPLNMLCVFMILITMPKLRSKAP